MGYHSKSWKNSNISNFILKKKKICKIFKKRKKESYIEIFLFYYYYFLGPCGETDPRLYRWIVEPLELLKWVVTSKFTKEVQKREGENRSLRDEDSTKRSSSRRDLATVSRAFCAFYRRNSPRGKLSHDAKGSERWNRGVETRLRNWSASPWSDFPADSGDVCFVPNVFCGSSGHWKNSIITFL